MKDINRIRGCLIDGAVGDALGYAVEFMKDSEFSELMVLLVSRNTLS